MKLVFSKANLAPVIGKSLFHMLKTAGTEWRVVCFYFYRAEGMFYSVLACVSMKLMMSENTNKEVPFG